MSVRLKRSLCFAFNEMESLYRRGFVLLFCHFSQSATGKPGYHAMVGAVGTVHTDTVRKCDCDFV